MLAIAVPVKDLNLQRAVTIVVAKGYHGNLYRSPDGIQGIVNALAFPHHGVGVVLVQSADVCAYLSAHPHPRPATQQDTPHIYIYI
jgi:hypothetical protein